MRQLYWNLSYILTTALFGAGIYAVIMMRVLLSEKSAKSLNFNKENGGVSTTEDQYSYVEQITEEGGDQDPKSYVNYLEAAQLGSFIDLLWILPALLAIQGLWTFFEINFKSYLLEKLKQRDSANYELKKKKIIKDAFSAFWYTSSAFVGLFMFVGSEYLPSECLGTLNCSNILSRWLVTPVTLKVKLFFAVQIAYHLFTAWEHFSRNILSRENEQISPEFNQMMLHHYLATVMVLLAFLSGFHATGVLVLIVSDLTDTFLNWGKFFRTTGLPFEPLARRLTDFSFVMTFISWILLRGIVLPRCVSLSCFGFLNALLGIEKDSLNPIAQLFISPRFAAFFAIKIGLFVVLILMNYYWVYLIVVIAYNRLTDKEKTFANSQWAEKGRGALNKPEKAKSK